MSGRSPASALLVLGTLAALAAPASAQDVGDPVFYSGPIEWSPSVALTEFGYDDNVFLESADRALADITGTLTPSIAAQIVTPRLELGAGASVDLVYFERYTDQRALNQSYSGRAAFTVSLFRPFVSGQWQDARDRRSPEVDLRARRRLQATSAGLGLFSLSRASLTLSVARTTSEYAMGQTFDGADLARELNRDADTATVGFNINLTPLTAFTVSASVLRERYHLVQNKDQETQQLTVGVTFAPDAVIRGRASVGYSRLTVEDPAAIPFDGITTDADVVFAFLETTRLTVRVSRATTASISEPYYLQTSYGGEVQQAFFGPTDLVLRASRQILDYPGIPSRSLAGHLDRVDSMAAGVIFRLSGRSTVDVTYELASREAVDPNQQFDRRRIITSVSLGF